MFHFIETVKVRSMARNLKSGDFNLYFANSVQNKPLISGLVSGFFGAGMGGMSFISSYNYLTNYAYLDPRFDHIDFRLKNMVIYLTSDLFASIFRVPFEARKQLVQMANYDVELKVIMRNTYYGLTPLMARDFAFRAIILGTYYGTTNIEHKPILRYSMPEIIHYMKLRRDQGHNDSMDDLKAIFYDHQNYDIKTNFTTRLTLLLLANFVGTLLTNPFDVCLTKILTQNPKDSSRVKYRGLVHTLRTVYREEGKEKFLSGLHPRFMFNMFNAVMYLFIFNRFTAYIDGSSRRKFGYLNHDDVRL